MREHRCSKDNEGWVDHSNHLPIGISKLSGPTEEGAVDELRYFRSGEAEAKVLMKYQLVE
jgi:hypothetical protein